MSDRHGCEGIMISPEFTRVAKIKAFTLGKPIGIQLAVMGSKSIINYGTNTTINIDGKKLKQYFDEVNIDYHNTILGMLFYLRMYTSAYGACNKLCRMIHVIEQHSP